MFDAILPVGYAALRVISEVFKPSEKPREEHNIMHAYLKIKIKSLAAEAVLIREEEQRLKAKHAKWRARAASRAGTPPPAVFFGLKDHRRQDVRRESRAGHLAYGFLRGTPYAAMEARCYEHPNWARVEQLIRKYGEGDDRDRMQRFSEWKEGTSQSEAA